MVSLQNPRRHNYLVVFSVALTHGLNDSAYLNVSGYNLLRTSVTDDGTFEGVAFTVGETTEHILLSLGHDFKGSFKVRIRNRNTLACS
jgi:hypothetical protein